jgi:hypothetical protein
MENRGNTMTEKFDKQYDLNAWDNDQIKLSILDEVKNAIAVRSPNRIRIRVEKLHVKKVTANAEQTEQEPGKVEEDRKNDQGTE